MNKNGPLTTFFWNSFHFTERSENRDADFTDFHPIDAFIDVSQNGPKFLTGTVFVKFDD